MRVTRLPSPGLGRVLLAALVTLATFAVATAAATAARPTPRIVNPDDHGPVPWQVGLMSSQPSPGLLPIFCGGTIRDATHVITAAHCLEDTSAADITVVAGFSDRAGTDPTMQRAAVSAITSHPAYDPATTNNDLAILTLATPLTLDGTNAVALPVVRSGESSENAWALISGWGDDESDGMQPQQLARATIQVYGDAACANYADSFIAATMLCAGWTNGTDYTIDTCQGDSGGPLARLVGADTADTLIGIVSWGDGCADPDFPGIYTRLSNPDLNQRATDQDPPARIEPTARPLVTGSANVGQTLSCDGAAWTQQPLSTTYRWLTAIIDAEGRPADIRVEGEGQTLALDAGDLGRVVTCDVAVTSLGGAYAQQARVGGPIGGPLPPPPAPPAPPVSPAPAPTPPPLPSSIDLEPPNARFTRQRCARQRCRLTVVARDIGGPATSAVVTYKRVSGCPRGRRGARCRRPKSVRAKARGNGIFELVTPRLAPARWRFTVVAVDAAKNRSDPVSVALTVPRRG